MSDYALGSAVFAVINLLVTGLVLGAEALIHNTTAELRQGMMIVTLFMFFACGIATVIIDEA